MDFRKHFTDFLTQFSPTKDLPELTISEKEEYYSLLSWMHCGEKSYDSGHYFLNIVMLEAEFDSEEELKTVSDILCDVYNTDIEGFYQQMMINRVIKHDFNDFRPADRFAEEYIAEEFDFDPERLVIETRRVSGEKKIQWWFSYRMGELQQPYNDLFKFPKEKRYYEDHARARFNGDFVETNELFKIPDQIQRK